MAEVKGDGIRRIRGLEGEGELSTWPNMAQAHLIRAQISECTLPDDVLVLLCPFHYDGPQTHRRLPIGMEHSVVCRLDGLG
jgi:hypothetical protein